MNKNIKILEISSRADFGGGPEHLYKLVSNLSKQFEVFMAAPDDEPYYKRYIDLIGEKKYLIIPHRKFEIRKLIELYQFIKKNDIKIIHSHGKGAGLYSRLIKLMTSVKIVHTFHGFHIGKYNSLQKFLYINLEKFFSLLTADIIAVSEGEKVKFINNKIAKSKKINVVLNGVMTDVVAVNENNFNKLPRKIISFTRFDYQKYSEKLFEIFEEIKKLGKENEFEFHLFGTGEGIKLFEDLVNQKKINNKFILHGAVNDPIDYLIGGFCYISTSRWEGLPLSILEAMSVGLPVIASDVVGNSDLIENDEDGFLFNLDQPEDATKLLIGLSKDFEKWQDISQKSIEKVKEKYSINKMVREIEKIYLK